uniref:NADH-ubiquinone oxidoreductase chain 6 n=1 Tax=Sinella curviseta TaxID=187695 RepID=A0A4P6DCW4_9HEXA|nr:NADH dehydrogenase subunit 6 [Sinella curviseta]QAU56476.1 NADH dehydrogenase subunit 6 [Sinella curviseta]
MFLSLATMIVSLTIAISSHPVSILMLILLQTLFICILMFSMLKTSWFSYILFLIFLGGLMVLFVYIVSLASNEKFSVNFSLTIILSAAVSFMSFSILYLSFFDKTQSLFSNNFFEQTMMIFSGTLVAPTILIMFYLLYTLIVAVKVSSKLEGPLRNFMG